MPRGLRIGHPHHYTALIGSGAYSIAGQDVTLVYVPAADTTPNQFTFTDQIDVAASTTFTHAAVTLSGLSGGTFITLNASGGTIDKNGDANFLGSQILQNGDTFRPRLTSSGLAGTSTSCTVVASPSGIQDTFTVTTVHDVVVSPGNDFFIGPSGSDSNTGLSQLSPWAYTALYSKATQIAGKQVGALDGIYRMHNASGVSANLGDQGFAQLVRSTASGSSGAPTILKAVTPRGASFQPFDGVSTYFNSSGAGAPSVFETQAAWFVYDGIEVAHTAGHGITVAASNVTVQNSHLWDMDNNRHTTQADTNQGLIYMRGTSKTNFRAFNNKLHDVVGKTGDANCIGDLFAVNGVLVENCTMYNAPTASYWKSSAYNIVQRYNHIYNCTLTYETWDTGVTGGAGTNEIYGNIIHGNSMGGPVSASSNGNACPIAHCYNNTIRLSSINGNPQTGYGMFVHHGGGSQALSYYNNAVLLDAAMTLGIMYRFPSGTVSPLSRIALWNFNRYSAFKVTDESGSRSAANIAAWKVFGYDVNSTVGALGLTNETDATSVANFTPALGSLLIGAGQGGINIGHTGLGVTPGCDF